MGVEGSRKNKRKGGIMLAHCFVLLHLYLNDLFRERERERGRYREHNRSGPRRRWLCAVLFDVEEKK